MKIIIVGAGEVGRHLCQQLSTENHEVVLIDRDAEHIRRIERELNILGIEGNGASPSVLEEAGISKADLFIAVTDMDEVNLISCIMAKEYGVERLVARVRNQEYISLNSPLSEHRLGIDLVINPDQVMAQEIVRISEISEAFEMVDFAHGEVVLLGYRIKPENPVCGLTLAQLRDLQGLYHFLVVAIVREGQTIIPKGSDIIQPEDRIYIVVRKKNISATEKLLNLASSAPKKVFIIGGGRVGFSLAEELEDKGVDVYIIEINAKRCEFLAEKLDRAVVLNFDGLEANELIAEGIDQADLVVAVTGGDTTNILASLLAKHHGAKKSITRISRPDFIPLLGSLGIDVALSARLVAANMILRFVRRGGVLSGALLLGGEAEVLEYYVSSQWPYIEKPLKKVKFPEGVIVGAVVRDDEVLIPSGDSVIKAGDRLVMFALKDQSQALEEFINP